MSSTPPEQTKDAGRRLATADDAAKEVFESANAWSEGIGKHSIETTYAVIAANWAAFPGSATILQTPGAKWSMGVAIAYLGFNLASVALLTYLLRRRVAYADSDRERWKSEHAQMPNQAWPYTRSIELLGSVRTPVGVLAPTVAAGFFLYALFRGKAPVSFAPLFRLGVWAMAILGGAWLLRWLWRRFIAR